jgi:hypothetical protein
VELTAILLSRVLAFYETPDLTPRGGMFFPAIVKELVQQYSFQSSPRTLEDWSADEGAQFSVGKFDRTVIEKLIIFNNGLQVDTRAGTSESKRIIEGMLGWAREKFGIVYGPKTVREWGYVNNLTFRSDVPLLVTGPMERLSKSITKEMSEILGRETAYEPTGFSIGHDQLLRRYPRAYFTLQRRAEVPLTDNKYFSESPLPTETHISLLEQYEKDVAEMLNPRLLASRP